MTQTTSKKSYTTPDLTVFQIETDIIKTSGVGVKYMNDDWDVMDDFNNG